MGERSGWGDDPLGPHGLVPIKRCGHWRPYRYRVTPERMNELAELHLGMACSWCTVDPRVKTNE